MTRSAAGRSHAIAPSELWVARNAANVSTAPRTGRRAGVSTQRRCDGETVCDHYDMHALKDDTSGTAQWISEEHPFVYFCAVKTIIVSEKENRRSFPRRLSFSVSPVYIIPRQDIILNYHLLSSTIQF